MIQQSINQMLGAGAVAMRFSDAYDRSMEARKAVKTARAATSAPGAEEKYGLAEIEENLKNPEKKYTQTELNDIEARVKEHNKNIYTAKTMNTPGHPGSTFAKLWGANKLPGQAEYGKMLSSIETNLEKRRMAMERVGAGLNAGVSQDQDFKAHRDRILGQMGGN